MNIFATTATIKFYHDGGMLGRKHVIVVGESTVQQHEQSITPAERH